MINISQILTIIKILIFVVNILLALIYSLSILLVHRLHHRSNILTLNLSFAFLCCCIYWLIYCTFLDYFPDRLFDINTCNFLIYAQMMCTCQLALAFITIPINRLFSIVCRTKLFFVSKQWIIICIVIQWILGFLISLPLLLEQLPNCVRPYWTSLYRVIMIVIVPSIISLCVNAFLFIYIRSSIRRVHPHLQPKNHHHHHDIRLFKHMIYMFAIFIIGWGPVFLLIAIDRQGDTNPVIYLILAFIAEGSLLSIIINLFKYNQKLRRYLKCKFFR